MDQGTQFVVGLAGGSGSGKTSLIRALMARFPRGSLCPVSQDDYYHPLERQQLDANGRPNFDLPTAVDLDQLALDLEHLRRGRAVRRREYTFNHSAREADWVEMHPAPVLLVEGLFIFHHSGVRGQLDLSVFVEASEEVQLERRLRRDSAERGYPTEEVHYQWQHHVLPAYRTWLAPHRDRCDLIVNNEASLRTTVDQLVAPLKAVLATCLQAV